MYQPNQFPCQFCGECPVWLAYGEENGPKTDKELYEACKSKNCPLYGRNTKEVEFYRMVCSILKKIITVLSTTLDQNIELRNDLNYLSGVITNRVN